MGRTKGSKNGVSTTPGYVAKGEKAKGRFVNGRYVYDDKKSTYIKGDDGQYRKYSKGSTPTHSAKVMKWNDATGQYMTETSDANAPVKKKKILGKKVAKGIDYSKDKRFSKQVYNPATWYVQQEPTKKKEAPKKKLGGETLNRGNEKEKAKLDRVANPQRDYKLLAQLANQRKANVSKNAKTINSNITKHKERLKDLAAEYSAYKYAMAKAESNYVKNAAKSEKKAVKTLSNKSAQKESLKEKKQLAKEKFNTKKKK